VSDPSQQTAGGGDRRFDVLVVGDANPDVIVAGAPASPAFGQAETLVPSAALTLGGSGAIMACACARLGLRTAFFGVVGGDYAGRFMLDRLAERGVAAERSLVHSTLPTGITVALVKDDAERDRGMLTALGCIPTLRSSAVPRDLLWDARHLHISSFYLQPELAHGLRELVDEAQDAGLSTSLDTNWDPSEQWDGGLRDVLGGIDLLLVNAEEARALAGVDDLADAAEILASRGSTAIIKCGAAGGTAHVGTGMVRVPGLTVEVVDTVGAGDTFNAGYLYGHLHDWTTHDSLALAVACGSLSTRAAGGTAAQPTLDEALAAAGLAAVPPT